MVNHGRKARRIEAPQGDREIFIRENAVALVTAREAKIELLRLRITQLESSCRCLRREVAKLQKSLNYRNIEVANLRKQIVGHVDRIADQSELLSKRAEKTT